VLLLAVFALCAAVPSVAQDANSAASNPPFGLTLEELVRQPTIRHPLFGSEARRKIGPFTLVPPSYPGELVRFSFPIGDFTVRAARVIRSAQHHRAERKAKAQVQRAIREWEAHQPR
jgi:hypothetical protein